jgi:hypothetical protein
VSLQENRVQRTEDSCEITASAEHGRAAVDAAVRRWFRVVLIIVGLLNGPGGVSFFC